MGVLLRLEGYGAFRTRSCSSSTQHRRQAEGGVQQLFQIAGEGACPARLPAAESLIFRWASTFCSSKSSAVRPEVSQGKSKRCHESHSRQTGIRRLVPSRTCLTSRNGRSAQFQVDPSWQAGNVPSPLRGSWRRGQGVQGVRERPMPGTMQVLTYLDLAALAALNQGQDHRFPSGQT